MPRARAASTALRLANESEAVRPGPAWAPLGRALLHHWQKLQAGATSSAPPLLYWSNLRPGEPETLPPELFFRRPAEMSALERRALELCLRQGGRAVDLGAGVGSHVLALQQRGLQISGLELCVDAVEVMKARGVECQAGSFWNLPAATKYDTMLMLMNTAGRN
ncbi:ARF1 [Symbiodinium natans]|uniref:ARF1 protein n=1 Tax=Symbiodinium natans TaxID=878477 RepID=A0A812S791_9DINO|nr:ARF1 [Symbiodinium natans]